MTPEKTGAIQGGRFRKGQSGNPAGKPNGSRHKASLAAEALLDGEAEKLTRKAVDMALEGDATALRICIDRIIPARRDRPMKFRLPDLASASEAATAMQAIIRAVANGEITPSEAQSVAGLIAVFVQAIETKELEERIAALEAKK